MGVLSPVLNGTGSVAIKSLATKHAVKAGMGAGEYAGQYANLRALVYVFGPLMMTSIYKWLSDRKMKTGYGYGFALTFGFLIPWLMHLTWKDADIFPEKEEQQGAAEAQKKKA